jgi:hypothetical protein
MSTQTALDNIRLVPSSRWGHTEYSLEYHQQYLEKRTGLPGKDPQFSSKIYERFAFDFFWSTNDGLIDWGKTGRVTDMGHAAYAADSSDQHQGAESPFKTVEEVWSFDAVAEYGLPDFDEQVKAYEKSIVNSRSRFPNQLRTGGYYKTIVSGAIQSFGWDMLLMAASEPDKFEKVLDSFFRRTLFHMKAWAKTSVEAVIQHDDFVWTGGAFMHPDIYRRVIIPRYRELWKPIHEAGKKVLFCSDGTITEFAADVAEAGADGLIFEPCNDFGFMADNFGKTKCLVGSYVDCRDLTFGKWDKVRSDIDRTFEKLAGCKGAILAVGNHLPANIPPEMLDRYFEYLLPRLSR